MKFDDYKNYIIEYGCKKLGYGPGWKTRVMAMSGEQAMAIYYDFKNRQPKKGPVKKSSTKKQWMEQQITIWDLFQERKENEHSIDQVNQTCSDTNSK